MNPAFISLLIRSLGFLLSAGQTVLLARILGAEDLGVYTTILALVTILSTPSSQGLSGYLTREVAVAVARGSLKDARGLVRSANVLLYLYFLISLLILFALATTDRFSLSDPMIVTASSLMILLLGTDHLRAGAMRGMGSALVSQIPDVILRPAIFMLAIVGLYWFQRDVSLVEGLMSFVVGAAGATLFGQIVLRRQLISFSPAHIKPMRHAVRGSFGLILLGALGTLQANLDVTIFAFFGYYVEAGQYRIALLGTVALLFVYDALSAVAVRDLAKTMAVRDNKQTLVISDRLTLWATGAALTIAVVYFLLSESAIIWIFGSEFQDASSALLILALGHTVAIACGPSMEIMRLLNSQRFGIVMNAVSIVVSLGVSLLLLVWNPLLGIAIGSATGNIVKRLTMAIYISKQLGANTTLVGAIMRLK